MPRTLVTAIESVDPADFPQFAALYDEEGYLTVVAWCEGRAVRNDYGVPGSPVWYAIEDIEVEEYEINCEILTPDQVRIKIGKELEEQLHEICADRAAEKEDWE